MPEACELQGLGAHANLLSNKLTQSYFCCMQAALKLCADALVRPHPPGPKVAGADAFRVPAALIATSTTHRSQIHNYVTSITISDPTHASDLISCSWPRLVKWTLADQDSHRMQTVRVTCDMTVAAASVLARASMLSRWQLQLDAIQLSAAVAAEIAKGDWPSLVGLYFWRATLRPAVVQELMAANWPALTLLLTLETPVDMDLLSLLSQARWPQLAVLSLFNSMLWGYEVKEEGIQHLSNASSRMVPKADAEQISSSSSATVDWSSITVLTLARQLIDTQMMTKLLHIGVNRLKTLILHRVQLDAAVILQLTKSECPGLESLTLCCDGLGSVAASCLAQGKWPLLRLLNLQGNELEDTALDELFTGKWPLLEELTLTVRLMHGKAIANWLGLSSDSVQEALRQPEQDVQNSEWEVKFSASNADMQPPLQRIRHVYPRLAAVFLCPPRPWAALNIS